MSMTPGPDVDTPTAKFTALLELVVFGANWTDFQDMFPANTGPPDVVTRGT
jgi:hypothetical protein